MRPNLITRLKEEWNNLDPVDPLRGLIADAIDALAEKPAQPSKPLPEDYTALEQALTRLQKRYADLEGKVGKPWVGLTQEEREHIWNTVGNSDAHGDVDGWSGRDVMAAIEAKLREKNT